MALADLLDHERNPRKHPAEGSAKWKTLAASLRESVVDLLIWNKQNGKLVSGHFRKKVMIGDGWTHAWVLVVDLDEPTHLARLHARGQVNQITLAASHYFRAVDSASTFRDVTTILRDRAKIIICRTHAKVILIPTEAGDFFVIEGSANLRSSQNVEQIVIVNDQATHDHHAAWIEELEHDGT